MVLKGDLIELGNYGMIAGAFSSTSGKADTTMTTNGQILYYNSGRQALNKGADGTVLTLASGLPSWAAAGSGAVELLDYEDFSADAASYTFTPASDLTAADYQQFFISITGKTDAVDAVPTIIFSGSTSGVYGSGATIAANGDRTSMYYASGAPIYIANTTTIDAAAKNFTCFLTLTLNPLASMATGYMETLNVDNISSEFKFFEVITTVIDSVEIEMTSTGKFKEGSAFAMYGLKTS